ncbi:MAG TPA: hypothetical protein VIK63_01530 [Haloplasmataceae bacterium]|uniref:Uncharacterized protein n=1 Tax=uncultured firmicutes bacterium contig_61 TaxID=1643555 RepID=A0A141GNH0_9FIRM|nr:hypothetical protein [uncultured firmicutes bacterium contig_61]
MKQWRNKLSFGLIIIAFAIGVYGKLFNEGFIPQLISLLLLLCLSFFILISEKIYHKHFLILDFLQTLLLLLLSVMIFVMVPALEDTKESLFALYLLLIIGSLINSVAHLYFNINQEVKRLDQTRHYDSK